MDAVTRRQVVKSFGIGLLGIGGWTVLGQGAGARRVLAQTKVRLSIATGGTGGVYYPLGGASRGPGAISSGPPRPPWWA